MGQNIYGGRITGTMSTGAPITATKYYGDGSSLTGVSTSGNFLQAPLIGQPIFANSGPWGKTTHDIYAYSTSNISTTANRIYLIPFQEQAGYTLDTLNIYVGTGVTSATVSVALYNTATASITNNSLTQTTTVPGTYSIIGSVAASTSGAKTITGINLVLPTTLNNTYYFAVMSSTTTVTLTSWGTNAVFPKWGSGVLASGTFYRAFNLEYAAPSFSFVNNINSASYSSTTGVDLLQILYTTK